MEIQILQKGSIGKDVNRIQTALKMWGLYLSTIDGIFGVITEEAVRQFQSRRRSRVSFAEAPLQVNGIVYINTWAEILKVHHSKIRLRTEIHPNVKAFLEVIKTAEGTNNLRGYYTMFTGKLFTSFADHPRQLQYAGTVVSDAAGAYQFLSTTWDELARELNLPDFSPASQDIAAIELIKMRRAYYNVIDGNIFEACYRCSWEWASLPPGRYNQPFISFNQASSLFLKYGGKIF